MKPLLYCFNKQAGPYTSLDVLSGESNFEKFELQGSTGLHATNESWDLLVGDLDTDGVSDVFCVNRNAGKNTELHVLSGSSSVSRFMSHAASALDSVGREWSFALGNFVGDEKRDLGCINRAGKSGQTELHVLSAESNFKTFILHEPTGLHCTNESWSFFLANWPGEKRPNLVCVNRNASPVEVHVLSAASNYKNFIVHEKTGLTNADQRWEFEIAFWTSMKQPDLFCINREGKSNFIEVHVLSGDSSYADFVLHAQTPLPAANANWTFALGQLPSHLQAWCFTAKGLVNYTVSGKGPDGKPYSYVATKNQHVSRVGYGKNLAEAQGIFTQQIHKEFDWAKIEISSKPGVC